MTYPSATEQDKAGQKNPTDILVFRIYVIMEMQPCSGLAVVTSGVISFSIKRV